MRYSVELDEVVLVKKLQNFLKEYIETDYTSGDKKFLVLNTDIEEVGYVVHRVLAPQGYKGLLEILVADDSKGEVLLTVDPPYQTGVKYNLVHLLPWVKEEEVKFSNEPEGAVTVTEKAAKKIKSILLAGDISLNKGGLRFALMPGGCSGLQYAITPEREPKENDEIFEKDFEEDGQSYTVRVFVDQRSLPFMKGSVIDYGLDQQQHNFTETFLINNPNKKGSCGCGNSVEF